MRSLNGLDEFDVLSQSIQDNIETISQVESSLSVFQGALTTLNSSVGNIEGSLTTLNSSVGTIEGSLTTLNSSVGNIEGSLTTLNSSVGNIEGSLTTLNTSVGTIEGSLTTLNSSVDTIEGSLNTLNTSVDTIEGSLTTLNTSVSTNQTDITSLEEDLANLNFTDLNGKLGNGQVNDTELTSSKTSFSTALSYATGSIGKYLVDKHNSFWTYLGTGTEVVSIAQILATLYQSSVNGITIGGLNTRLTALDAPLVGKVPVLEGEMTEVETKTSAMLYNSSTDTTQFAGNVALTQGTKTLSCGKLVVNGSITNSELQEASSNILGIHSNIQSITYSGGTTTINGRTELQMDFLKLTNKNTTDLPATDANYTHLGWDRNIGTEGNRPAFFYKDPDNGGGIAYLLDTQNVAYLDGYVLPESVIPRNLSSSLSTSGDILCSTIRPTSSSPQVVLNTTNSKYSVRFGNSTHEIGRGMAYATALNGADDMAIYSGADRVGLCNDDGYVRIDLNGHLGHNMNTDTTAILGRTRLHSATTDTAMFSHFDYSGENNFCLKHQANGNTVLNGTSYVYITENNNNGFRFDGSAGQITTYGRNWPSFNFSLPVGFSASGGYLCYFASTRDLKRDIEDLETERTTNIVENIRPVWYRMKNMEDTDPKKDWGQYGLIAEELQEIDPRLVAFDGDGITPASVYYDRLGLHAIHYIQKVLNPKIASLEAKLSALLPYDEESPVQ